MRNLTAAELQILSRATLTLFVLAGVLFSSYLVGLHAKQKGACSMQENFALTTKAQEAVFITSYGWTGGMGEAVLDPATGGIKFFKGGPVFVDSEVIRRLLEGKLPDSWVGELRVGIKANIKLVLKTRENPSVPGAPKETPAGADLLFQVCDSGTQRVAHTCSSTLRHVSSWHVAAGGKPTVAAHGGQWSATRKTHAGEKRPAWLPAYNALGHRVEKQGTGDRLQGTEGLIH